MTKLNPSLHIEAQCILLFGTESSSAGTLLLIVGLMKRNSVLRSNSKMTKAECHHYDHHKVSILNGLYLHYQVHGSISLSIPRVT